MSDITPPHFDPFPISPDSLKKIAGSSTRGRISDLREPHSEEHYLEHLDELSKSKDLYLSQISEASTEAAKVLQEKVKLIENQEEIVQKFLGLEREIDSRTGELLEQSDS